jgi:hypothetical protein
MILRPFACRSSEMKKDGTDDGCHDDHARSANSAAVYCDEDYGETDDDRGDGSDFLVHTGMIPSQTMSRSGRQISN